MLIWIPSRLPSLNDLLDAKGTVRGQWNKYNQQKSVWFGQVKGLCLARNVGAQDPGYGTFLFVEPNQKRDPDNIVAGGVKLLFDSFVGAGVLAGDGWRDNLGFVGYWTCKTARAGCLVHWGPELLTKETMLSLLEKELNRGITNDRRGTFSDEPAREAAAGATRRRNA